MLSYLAGNMFGLTVPDTHFFLFKKIDDPVMQIPEERNLINDTMGISPSENEGTQLGY